MRVELDMLDLEEQPPNAKKIAEEWLLSADDNPWDRSAVDSVLIALANSLAEKGQGEYYDRLEPSSSSHTDSKPVVEFAPALILRKRSVKGLEQTLEKMMLQVEAGNKIPSLFGDLCEINGGEKVLTDDFSTDYSTIPHSQYLETDSSIYFPLPSNEDQNRIIHQLRSSHGVLVQGPPGTGKSHTIANLICHLLATGRRILITAKTPRALQVLHGMLPEKLQPLCISLLGSGIEEQRSLERSVSGILHEQYCWNEDRTEDEVERLTESLQQLKSKRAEIDHRIRSIRESETFSQSIINGAYRGTAAQIARQFKKESSELDWFIDRINYDLEPPFTSEYLIGLREELITLTPEREAELKLSLPDTKEEMPSPEEFKKLVKQEVQLNNQAYASAELFSSQVGQLLGKEGFDRLNTVIDHLSKLNLAVANISNRPLPWIENAVYDMLTDNDTPWKELHRVFSKKLSCLGERARKIEYLSVEIPEGLDWGKLLLDAETLKEHFKEGGKIRRIIPNNKPIRECKYLAKMVKVDGRPCDSSKTLEQLIEYLSMVQSIDYCWNLWKGKADKKKGPLFLQVAELEELLEALISVISLYEMLEAAKDSIRLIQGLSEPAWYKLEERNKFLNTCRAVVSQKRLQEIKNQLNQYKTNIQSVACSNNTHPITQEILLATQNRDVDKYLTFFTQIEDLKRVSEQAQTTKNTLQQLSRFAPVLTQDLSQNPSDEKWHDRLERFEKACTWARAKSWLEDFLNKDDLPSLERQRKRLEKEIKDNIESLAAKKAWKFCFSRMKEDHRRHLIGWQQAMKKVGKGTGKHAPKYRREAQKHLNQCKEAVPAWVMPLHRVYETVDPVPGIFDLIIVDEASQCGPESLPLTYLAEQLLVVGDDQQISPEAVGIKPNDVDRLKEEHLKGFEHADAFDMRTSLFDNASRRFGNRIVLREHFRCMPEIIWFSNDLCYQATPLIPLKQSHPNRLEPTLNLVHVSKGYREGKYQRVINHPEAERVVQKIIECCVDKRYTDKTMGVISLQGDAQADLIQNKLLAQLGAEEIENRRLICGNPYSFQGDERDIVFLSMVAAPNERIGPFTKTTDRQRFNVAASRAKEQMWLFHSATCNDLSKDCLRYRLLEFFENPKSQISESLGEDAEKLRETACKADRWNEKPKDYGYKFDSWFEVDVALAIASYGYRVIPQYYFAGKWIDLVIEGTQARLAVECDGENWHSSPEQFEKDMERQRMLERCKLQFYRIRESAYYADPEKALEGLWQTLEERGIKPISRSANSTQETNKTENLKTDLPGAKTDIKVKPSNYDPKEFKHDELKVETVPQPSPVEAKAKESSEPFLTGKTKVSPYKSWTQHTLPDPRESSLNEVAEGFIEIVSYEGPITQDYAYHIYAKAAGIGKVGRLIRNLFDRAVSRAFINGKLEKIKITNNEKILKMPGTKSFCLRTRGDRSLEDIPLNELAEVVLIIGDINTDHHEEIFRMVLDQYGLKRMTKRAVERLETAFKLSKSIEIYSEEKPTNN